MFLWMNSYLCSLSLFSINSHKLPVLAFAWRGWLVCMRSARSCGQHGFHFCSLARSSIGAFTILGHFKLRLVFLPLIHAACSMAQVTHCLVYQWVSHVWDRPNIPSFLSILAYPYIFHKLLVILLHWHFGLLHDEHLSHSISTVTLLFAFHIQITSFLWFSDSL